MDGQRGDAANTRRDDPRLAVLFDLDGTLVDSVYHHATAWHTALNGAGIELSVWRIHRRIGMSGGLFVNALARELGHRLTAEQVRSIQDSHERAYTAVADRVRALPGAIQLLGALTRQGVPWSIATSGRRATAQTAIGLLGVADDVPVVTRDEVSRAKPDPDLFLFAADRLRAPIENCLVVGDSVWDMLAGAYRVYDDPADLLRHLDEVGVRPPGAELS